MFSSYFFVCLSVLLAIFEGFLPSGISKWREMTPVLRCIRLLSAQSGVEVNVNKALLSKLRKKTGFPLIKCRKALEQFNNDVKQAEVWMREQAQREGWEKAGKLQDRPMSQGLVSLLHDDKAVTMLEINCETDFVARNENFQALASQLTEACHSNFFGRSDMKIVLGKEEVNSIHDAGKPLSDHVALTVLKLGENIALRRAAFFKLDPDTIIRSFIHASGPQMMKDRCKLGKFAAVVKLEAPNMDHVAKELCQHIIGMNPKVLGDWESAPVVKKDSKHKKKEESVTVIQQEEETRLLDQEFLLEPKFNVREYLKGNAPKVVDFVRIECGEDLGEDD